MVMLTTARNPFGFGVVTLLEGGPIWLGTPHQAGAMLLLATWC